MKKLSLLLFVLLISISITNAQSGSYEKGLSAINETAVQGQLEFLSSDWMEGRETGTKGIYMAADYLVSLFKIWGIEPAGDMEWVIPSRDERRAGKEPYQFQTYYQYFSLLKYEPGENQELALINSDGSKIILSYRTDFYVNTGTVGTEATAEVVFAGYGYKNDDYGYNDFEGVDTEGKILLVLDGYPGHKDTSSEAYKKFHPEGRYAEWYLRRNKSQWAEETGALGIISINLDGDAALGWADNDKFRYNGENFEGAERLTAGQMGRLTLPGDELSSSMSTIYLSSRAANELIKNSGINFEDFEESAKVDMEPDSKELDGKSIYLKTSVKSEIIKVRNVVGKIEGENPDEIIVVGGHYDHVGTNQEYIWNGSDDNGSGTVGVWTIAKAFAESGVKPKKTIVFAAWTGEEKGLLGSRYFADNWEEMDKVILNLNYDMISRDDDDDSLGVKCSMNYTESVKLFEDTAVKYNDDLNLGLEISFRPSPQPRGGSDHSSFSSKDIPVFYYMAGFHPDYHQYTDHVNKANFDKMTKIIKLGFSQIWHIATSDLPLDQITTE
ncbi:MAG: M20/M25/M40 family metallo-hydrolase [Melioribacteraceae bacterium]|nr:M20/M25/M40 family metallo-hydrolase [Melioribacteraceae bacterium]MCF8353848.1 M20/M25/M40 family metallo-hydrolase [Melioribacteraceae bacterium]MCF8393081.1 M20/M25/M40 family metallo-hydrolase [Melioribacteraceae bacterium]MCF8419200.1 M20/M25/M40 family metallo-hydrolase [Melioribacteraceae bacterium]